MADRTVHSDCLEERRRGCALGDCALLSDTFGPFLNKGKERTVPFGSSIYENTVFMKM